MNLKDMMRLASDAANQNSTDMPSGIHHNTGPQTTGDSVREETLSDVSVNPVHMDDHYKEHESSLTHKANMNNRESEIPVIAIDTGANNEDIINKAFSMLGGISVSKMTLLTTSWTSFNVLFDAIAQDPNNLFIVRFEGVNLENALSVIVSLFDTYLLVDSDGTPFDPQFNRYSSVVPDSKWIK